jgi:hypothetical protein
MSVSSSDFIRTEWRVVTNLFLSVNRNPNYYYCSLDKDVADFGLKKKEHKFTIVLFHLFFVVYYKSKARAKESI